MEDWRVGISKIIKQRDNISKIGNQIGKVVSELPDLKISFLDGNAILTMDDLYCCNGVFADSDVYEDTFKSGDLVLLVPDESESKWFIIDKITKL